MARDRWRVLVLTWVSYASYYLCRKNVAVSKTAIEESLHVSTGALGGVDTGYLAAYALGMFAMGPLGDALGSRRLVGTGMIAAAVCTAIAGAAPGLAVLLVAFTLNGFAQSSGWPGNVKAITPWLEKSERGRVMGLWSTCYQLGGLAAGALTAAVLARLGWRAAFCVPAALVVAVGVAVLAFLPERAAIDTAKKSATQRALFRMPALWSLGAGYFGLKLIRYALLFWLPYYLERELHYAREDAGLRSLAFEAGGTIGAVAVGFASDRLLRGRRAAAGIAGCVALAGAFVLYGAVARLGPWPNFLGLALVGACLFGPDSLVSAAAAQDLGGAEASGTAAGFINGMGSVGAVLQGALTAWITARWGWDALFVLFVGLALFAAAALVPMLLRERRTA